MRMNRRNVLVGLGTIVAGGGAALGTGAFSSVEADRTASLSVADDSNALLTLSGDTTSSLISETDGVLEISQTDINLEATTTVDEGLDIVNKSTQPIQLSVSITPGDVTGSEATAIFGLEYVSGSSDNSQIYTGSINGTTAPDEYDLAGDGDLYLESGASATFDLVVDTSVDEANSLTGGDSVLESVTFTAQDTS